MPLIYGLIWNTPQTILDLITGSQFFLTEDSIDELFPLMVKDKGIKVMFNFEVIVSHLRAFMNLKKNM